MYQIHKKKGRGGRKTTDIVGDSGTLRRGGVGGHEATAFTAQATSTPLGKNTGHFLRGGGLKEEAMTDSIGEM